MPSNSKAQQHFFGYLHSHPDEAKRRGIDMTSEQIADFASTKTKGLPEHAPKRRHTASDSLHARMRGA